MVWFGGKWRGGKKRCVLDSRFRVEACFFFPYSSAQSFDSSSRSLEPKAAILLQERLHLSSQTHAGTSLLPINCHWNEWNNSPCLDPPRLSCRFLSLNKQGDEAAAETRWISGVEPALAPLCSRSKHKHLLFPKQNFRTCIVATAVTFWPLTQQSDINYFFELQLDGFYNFMKDHQPNTSALNTI